MRILLVGGTFDHEGGRPSGYFGKLAASLCAALPDAQTQVINGGTFAALQSVVNATHGVSHLLWFSDVPNDLPKLLPVLKQKFPDVVLVSSKNNRQKRYERAALFERMRHSRSELLVEFGEGDGGVLLGSVLAAHGEVLVEASPRIEDIAACLAARFQLHETPSGTAQGSRERICIVGERGLVSQALQAQLSADARYHVVVSSTESVSNSHSLAETAEAALIVLCTLEFASAQVLSKLPAHARVLDVSPAFRMDPEWVYGLPELPEARERIRRAPRVANPGCFATSAILALEPLVRAGSLSPATPLYLDGTGGFTTGGTAMIQKEAAGELAAEAVFSLTREHRHIPEIKRHAGLTGPVVFNPKIARVPRGIRMQVPLFGIARETALRVLGDTYAGTSIVVDPACPSRIPVDEWAHRKGACLRVFDQPDGCLVVCTLDNLGKGAVDSAVDNIALMLGAWEEQPRAAS